ncbi:MAG: ADP-ribosylglycohydrolase family protein, partial [Thermotogota bacterium]|nr:ADP-ribosylglycohydrolase family protein [Thermotogota bacterium]
MKLDNIQGAFIGGAIGDALGFPHEMLNKYKGMTGFFPWRMVRSNKYITKHIDIKPGTYSDDTQMMLAVARSINSNGFDQKRFVFELKEWLSYELGGGKATKKAVRNIKYKNDEFLNFYEGYTKAGGNGTVMRILPHIVSSDNYSQILKNALEDTLITHGSPVAVLGEVYFSSFLYQLFNGEEPIKAHKQAVNQIMDFNLAQHVSNKWLKKWKSVNGEPYEKVEERIKKQLQQKSLLLIRFLELSKTDKDYYTAIGATGMYKGSAINSTLAAVYTLIKHFTETFLKTISIPCCMENADTDTVGLMTGIL